MISPMSRAAQLERSPGAMRGRRDALRLQRGSRKTAWLLASGRDRCLYVGFIVWYLRSARLIGHDAAPTIATWR